jgi:hypothetical protein
MMLSLLAQAAAQPPAPPSAWTSLISPTIVAAVVAGFIQILILWRNTTREQQNKVRDALAEFGGYGLQYLASQALMPGLWTLKDEAIQRKEQCKPLLNEPPSDDFEAAQRVIEKIDGFMLRNHEERQAAQTGLFATKCKLRMLSPTPKVDRDIDAIWGMIMTTPTVKGEALEKDMKERMTTLEGWMVRLKQDWIRDGAKRKDIQLQLHEGGKVRTETIKAEG